jgi:release factor glutamine methyltransferase
MTAKQVLARARSVLGAASIEDAPFEAELLLRDTLKIDRVQLYLDFDLELSPKQQESYWQRIERRLNHEPAAYIVGHREFYGLDFLVDSGVLIPRPESEMLVDRALELTRNRTLSAIAEVGTGCGAIAISLALNLPHTTIYATDISAAALRVARRNCRRHGMTDRVFLVDGDMLDPLPGSVDLIVANLPYVRQSELTGTGPLTREPRLALDGGPDGLQKIRRLCLQAGSKLNPGGGLLLEIGQGQAEAITAFLHNVFPSPEIELVPDLSGIERVVSITLH